jgi:hypothetical protein
VIFLPPVTSSVHPPKIRRSQNKKASTSVGPADPPQLVRPLTWPLRDIISLCIQNFVPSGELLRASSDPICTQSRICGSWVEVLPTLIGRAEDDYLLAPAIKAFGFSIAASGAAGRAPIPDALEAQCSALRVLQSTITNSKLSFNALSSAIMCLCLSGVSPNLYPILWEKAKILFANRFLSQPLGPVRPSIAKA